MINILRGTQLAKIPEEQSQQEYAPPQRPTPPRPTRSLSEAAAQAAQNVIDMESELQQLRHSNNSFQAQLTVFEESNRLLHEEVDRLRRSNDRLFTENVAVIGRINIAAEILLRLKSPLSDQERTDAEHEKNRGIQLTAEQEDQIAAAIKDDGSN